MESSEIRSWVQLIFLVIGGVVGLLAYFQNMKQRKIENALKMTAWFHDSISEKELEGWKTLFHATSEPAGAKYGCYVHEGSQLLIFNYFSEGSPDEGAVGRIADCLEVICHEIVEGSVDSRFIWFEFGQLLRTIHHWLDASPSTSNGLTLLESAFPYFNNAFKKYDSRFKRWPSRTHAYVE